ncbi:VCBS repeat-containing protein [Microvenator marinus]|uniref:VCBS repeat-containing protein n=1 Tax=Microvenator marinus TaxID=2600177 RepID=A0A5B8XXC8_9DELT|nr:VCBS repeat-containing protein [Microvenator marinus]QED29791.1 VCBS repeat-containing protein [Microvenator marinus]
MFAKRLLNLLFTFGVMSVCACGQDDGPALVGGPDPITPNVDMPNDTQGPVVSDGGPLAPDAADLEPGTDMAAPPSDQGNQPPDCSRHYARRPLDAAQSASWRYGGGAGYPDAFERDPACMTIVDTKAALEAALEAAQSGDIVYVEDDAEIDITGPSICIPGGVWLVSGRGRGSSAGALLYGTEIVNRTLLDACGADVRLSGIRLHGPDPSQCPPQYPDNCTGEDRTNGQNCRDCMPRTSGIRSRHDGLEVDNSEIAGFGLAAVNLSDSVGHWIHHSHIHHNQRQGLGYGVLLGRGSTGVVKVLVEHNRMDYMRHAIAGSGEPGQDYEARYNLVLENANGHVFDMHGENENTDNGSELAGGRMLIHNNTVLPPDHYALVVRGRPQTGSWLYDNCLARSGPSSAALQRFFTGNFHVDRSPSGSAPNQYNQTGADCEPVRWCYSAGGSGPWRYLTASSFGMDRLALGDFDGDGKTDVFSTSSGKWRWVTSGLGSWKDLNTSNVTIENLGFGDFDGDGKTDVFNANGSAWRYSSGGSSPWTTLRNATETLSSLVLADFDGDGKTDVFTTTGTHWRWSRSGTQAWANLNTSSAALSSLRFGDFDGDGKTDAFSTGSGQWRWSPGASEPWRPLNSSGVGLASLHFADVTGDGKTDVLRANGDRWWVSDGGNSGWRMLRIDSKSPGNALFGDFDGDGTADVFNTGCF